MILNCPITSLQTIDLVRYENITLITPHPVLGLKLETLAKLAQEEKLSRTDKDLLFIALLAKLPTVQISGKVTLPFPAEYPDFLGLYGSQLLALLNWQQAAKADYIDTLPKFSLSFDTLLAAPNYLAALREIKNYGRYIPKDYTPEEREARLAEAKELAKARAVRKAKETLKLSTVAHWAIRELKYSAPRAKLFMLAIRKGGIGSDALQEIINDCLECLPERHEYQALQKSWLVDKLLAQLIEVNTIQAALGLEVVGQSDFINALKPSFTIETSNNAMPNTATETGKALADAAKVQNFQATQTAPTTPTQQPIRADYKNELAYTVALRTWKLANS